MHLIAVDDERPALRDLVQILEELFPADLVHGFENSNQALELIRELVSKDQKIEYAFLDIKMSGMSGLKLAEKLKTISPGTKILFVTGYDNYALEAFKVHARGYILKPVTKELVEEELHNIEWYSAVEQEERKDGRIRVQTFGHFDVFTEGRPVYFSRKSEAPEKAIWLMYSSTSSAVMPSPLSINLSVFSSGFTRI